MVAAIAPSKLVSGLVSYLRPETVLGVYLAVVLAEKTWLWRSPPGGWGRSPASFVAGLLLMALSWYRAYVLGRCDSGATYAAPLWYRLAWWSVALAAGVLVFVF